MKAKVVLIVSISLSLAGCPSSVQPDDAGPGTRDAGDPGTDAGSDAGTDAGRPTEVCEVEMATRTAPCGNCGLASETCTGGVWSRTSACLDEGECAPGAVETEALPMCAQQQRICTDECTWRAWTMTMAEGECEAGDTRLVTTSACGAGLQPQRCSSACLWEDEGPCDDGCGGTARTTPEWKREVCIPAGPFNRGFVGDAFAEPIAEIDMSAYYLDVYPVTNTRWSECMDAGACDLPYGDDGRFSIADATRGDYPVQGITFSQAVAFCAWDGSRRLPTQAEWEKAARGPAPRAQRWVWEGDAYRCDLVAGPTCAGGPPGPTAYALDEYDALPGSRGYYGTFLQYGGVLEVVSDYWVSDWYSDPASRVSDPTGPATSAHRTAMGVARGVAGPTRGISLRRGLNIFEGDSYEVMLGFRCAREASP